MQTVKTSELSNLKMVGGNEKKYTTVISGGVKKHWVGIGWVDEGPATEEDRRKYPEVAD